ASTARHVPLETMRLELRSNGNVDRSNEGRPRLRAQSSLVLGGAAFDGVAASSLALELRTIGTAWQHEIHAELRSNGLTFDNTPLGDDHLSLALSLDRDRSSLHAELAEEGLSKTKLGASLAFDRERQRLSYTLSGRLGGFGRLAALVGSSRALSG